MHRGLTAEINLDAVSNNVAVINKLSNSRPPIAVVKADAYGHGAVEVSMRLLKDGVKYLAVAFTDEARQLRDAGINSPVIVLFDTDVQDVIEYNLIPVVSDKKTAALISKEAEKAGRKVSIHIKVDTGMGRLGITGDAVDEITEIAGMKNLGIVGIMSHFSEADLSDASFAGLQIEKFRDIKSKLGDRGLAIKLFHMANSAAVIALPDSHFDAVRPGLMIYGYSPLISNKLQVTSYKLSSPLPPLDKGGSKGGGSSLVTRHLSLLEPVMSVKARIVALRKLPAGAPVSYGRTFITKRDSLIGVISAGYADGFSRRFSNNLEVLVKGVRAPVAGRVCMDLTMVDLTDVEGVTEDDEVVIIGKQGNGYIDAHELAQKADTIPYEILTSLGSRAKRIYM